MQQVGSQETAMVCCPQVGGSRPNLPRQSCVMRVLQGGCRNRPCSVGNEIRKEHGRPIVEREEKKPPGLEICACGQVIHGKRYGKKLCSECRAKDPEIIALRKGMKRQRNKRYWNKRKQIITP